MGLITHHSASGYRCDKGGCTNKISGQPLAIHRAEEHYQALAERLGWTFTRKRRLWVHCPDHARKDES